MFTNTFFYRVSGSALVRVGILHLERTLSICAAHNMIVWNVCRWDTYGTMHLRYCDYRVLTQIAEEKGFAVECITVFGLPSVFRSFRQHIPFAAGFLCCLLLFFLMLSCIWDIRLIGNNRVSDDRLYAILRESGIAPFKATQSIDCQRAAACIRAGCPEVTWVSVQISGVCVIVELIEDLPAVPPKVKPETGDFISPYDGRILSIMTRSGVPIVSEGSIVKKGDVLVSSQLAIIGDDAAVIRYDTVPVDADIMIETLVYYYREYDRKVTKRDTDSHPKRDGLILRTGNTVFYMGIRKKQNSDQYYYVDLLSLSESTTFPLSVSLIHRTVYTQKEITFSDEHLLKIAQTDLTNYLADLAKKGIQIRENNVKIDTCANKCTATGSITVARKAERNNTGNE